MRTVPFSLTEVSDCVSLRLLPAADLLVVARGSRPGGTVLKLPTKSQALVGREDLPSCSEIRYFRSLRCEKCIPLRSMVVRRRDILRLPDPTSFHPLPVCCSSSELGNTVMSSISSDATDDGEPGSCCGGGGISSMNQSWCAIRNSKTFWLRACSCGDIS